MLYSTKLFTCRFFYVIIRQKSINQKPLNTVSAVRHLASGLVYIDSQPFHEGMRLPKDIHCNNVGIKSINLTTQLSTSVFIVDG